MNTQGQPQTGPQKVPLSCKITSDLINIIAKIINKNPSLSPLEDILKDPDFDAALLIKLTDDLKFSRLTGMLKGSENFVTSQEKRQNLTYSAPERAALILKNLGNCLPSLYGEKAAPKGPATRPPQLAKTLPPIAFLDDIATLPDAEFLDQIFLRGAISDLMEGSLESLDPVTGDAACQLRAPFFLDAEAEIREFMKGRNIDLALARQLIHDFPTVNGLKGHQMPPIQSLRLRWRPEASLLNTLYKGVLAQLKSSLGQDNKIDTTSYLALGKALTMTQIAYVDPFGLPAIRQNLTLYRDGLELDKRKVALSSIARDYILSRTDNPALRACLEGSQAYVSLGKGGRIPCLPMYPGLRAVLLHEQKQRRNLVVYLKRLAFKGTSYHLNGAEVFCFKPMPGGGYALVDELGNQNPTLCIDAWSMIDEEDTPPPEATSALEQALYSQDYATYRKAFLSADILNLILAAAAAHAPFPAAGRSSQQPEGWADCGRAYAEDLMRQASGAADMSHPLGVDTLLGQSTWRETCHQEYSHFLDYLGSRNLFDLIYCLPDGAKNPPVTRRIARSVPFTPVHIHASTLAAKQAECGLLRDKAKAGLATPRDITFADTALPASIRGFK